jgi:hypothetical protein
MVEPTPSLRPKGAAKARPNTDEPVFAQPQPSPDPTSFKNPVTDQNDTEIASLEPVPQPVGGAAEPILTLAQTYGSAGNAKVLSSIRSVTRAASSDPTRNRWWQTRWSQTSMRPIAPMYRPSSFISETLSIILAKERTTTISSTSHFGITQRPLSQ